MIRACAVWFRLSRPADETVNTSGVQPIIDRNRADYHIPISLSLAADRSEYLHPTFHFVHSLHYFYLMCIALLLSDLCTRSDLRLHTRMSARHFSEPHLLTVHRLLFTIDFRCPSPPAGHIVPRAPVFFLHEPRCRTFGEISHSCGLLLTLCIKSRHISTHLF